MHDAYNSYNVAIEIVSNKALNSCVSEPTQNRCVSGRTYHFSPTLTFLFSDFRKKRTLSLTEPDIMKMSLQNLKTMFFFKENHALIVQSISLNIFLFIIDMLFINIGKSEAHPTISSCIIKV